MDARSDMARLISGGLFSSWKALATRSFTGTPRRWEEHGLRRVRWLDDRVPDSEEAKVIREALAVRGHDTYGEIARYAADRLFRKDHAAHGWVADIGLFRGLYLLHACQSLERLQGRLVLIEEEAPPWS